MLIAAGRYHVILHGLTKAKSATYLHFTTRDGQRSKVRVFPRQIATLFNLTLNQKVGRNMANGQVELMLKVDPKWECNVLHQINRVTFDATLRSDVQLDQSRDSERAVFEDFNT